jgi:2-C-methyl-D-erythritol 4-phosphate cytidylyltransferase
VALPCDLAAAPPAYLTATRAYGVAGGARRQDSVANAFAAAAGADVVVIHDAARPFVSADLIARTVAAAAEFGAAIAALARPRHRQARGRRPRDHGDAAPARRSNWRRHRRAFRASVLRDALASGAAGADATDEAVLAERAGHPVRLVDGDARNIKITTRRDLALAESLVAGGAPPAPLALTHRERLRTCTASPPAARSFLAA